MDDKEIIQLEMLGRWNASIGGRDVHVGLRQQRLLAALAIYGTRSRRFLGGLLWPKCTESHALGSLRSAAFTLSRRLPGAVMCHGTDLGLEKNIDVDLHRLQQVLDHPESFALSSEQGRWFLAQSRVELLPGWCDDWVASEADRLREDYADFVEMYADTALAQGNPHQAILLARAAHRLDPLREDAVRLLVQGHLALGDEPAALREYRDYCAVVAQELGSRPSDNLTDLFQDLLRNRAPSYGKWYGTDAPIGDSLT